MVKATAKPVIMQKGVPAKGAPVNTKLTKKMIPQVIQAPKKDKNAPKRNWTAYAFYVEEVSLAAFLSVC